MEKDQAKQLKELQKENARLKKLVAELSLDKSIWSSCAQLGISRATLYRYLAPDGRRRR